MAEMIAYLIHTFPQFSSTFVNDEVDEMRRQGEKIAIFGVQRPGPMEYPQAFQKYVDETTYVFPMHKGRLMLRHLDTFIKKPGSYLKCLVGVLTHPDLTFRNRARTLFHFAEAVYIYPEIRSRDCTRLHVHFLFGGAAIAYFLHRIHGLTYSLTAHGSDIFVERLLQPEKLAMASFIRVSTEYNAGFLRPIMPEGRCQRLLVIPFGIDRSKIPGRTKAMSQPFQRVNVGPNRMPVKSDPVRILTVGRLIWQKAQHLLLEACADLVRQGIGFHLRLVGEGPLRPAIEKQITDLGLAGNVTMVGALPQEQVWLEYRRTDLFILSSISEGSPFVILEAMACGLPVIAPDLHGIPEMIEDSINGRLFKTGSVQSLVEAMMELIKNETIRKRLGATAEISAGQIDLAKSVNRFRKLFQAFPQEM